MDRLDADMGRHGSRPGCGDVPGARLEPSRPRGRATRAFGTVRNGGPFENLYVIIALTAGDHIQHYEAFDVADTERAVARFEERCATRAS